MLSTSLIFPINQKLRSKNPLETPEGTHCPKILILVQVFLEYTKWKGLYRKSTSSEVINLAIQINPCKPQKNLSVTHRLWPLLLLSHQIHVCIGILKLRVILSMEKVTEPPSGQVGSTSPTSTLSLLKVSLPLYKSELRILRHVQCEHLFVWEYMSLTDKRLCVWHYRGKEEVFLYSCTFSLYIVVKLQFWTYKCTVLTPSSYSSVCPSYFVLPFS